MDSYTCVLCTQTAADDNGRQLTCVVRHALAELTASQPAHCGTAHLAVVTSVDSDKDEHKQQQDETTEVRWRRVRDIIENDENVPCLLEPACGDNDETRHMCSSQALEAIATRIHALADQLSATAGSVSSSSPVAAAMGGAGGRVVSVLWAHGACEQPPPAGPLLSALMRLVHCYHAVLVLLPLTQHAASAAAADDAPAQSALAAWRRLVCRGRQLQLRPSAVLPVRRVVSTGGDSGGGGELLYLNCDVSAWHELRRQAVNAATSAQTARTDASTGELSFCCARGLHVVGVVRQSSLPPHALATCPMSAEFVDAGDFDAWRSVVAHPDAAVLARVHVNLSCSVAAAVVSHRQTWSQYLRARHRLSSCCTAAEARPDATAVHLVIRPQHDGFLSVSIVRADAECSWRGDRLTSDAALHRWTVVAGRQYVPALTRREWRYLTRRLTCRQSPSGNIRPRAGSAYCCCGGSGDMRCLTTMTAAPAALEWSGEPTQPAGECCLCGGALTHWLTLHHRTNSSSGGAGGGTGVGVKALGDGSVELSAAGILRAWRASSCAQWQPPPAGTADCASWKQLARRAAEASWPTAVSVSYHGIDYAHNKNNNNGGRAYAATAEARDHEAMTLRLRAVSRETASTCSVWRSDAVRLNRAPAGSTAAAAATVRRSPRKHQSSLARARTSSAVSVASAAAVSSSSKTTTSTGTGASGELKQRLRRVIVTVLGEHGVTARQDGAAFRRCARQLYTMVRAYVRSSRVSTQCLLEHARAHAGQVVHFQRGDAANSAQRQPNTSDC